MRESTTDVLVVGSGIAGCTAALSAARAGATVALATTAERPEDTTSWWAQGGVAVTRDDPEAFARDVLEASDGTADPDAVDVLVSDARAAVADVLLETLDVPFDRAAERRVDERSESTDRASGDEGAASSESTDRASGARSEQSEDRDQRERGAERPANRVADNGFAYAREAAHSERRVLHVDARTGRAILPRFLDHLDGLDAVDVRTDTAALDLVTHEGRVHGALLERDGDVAPCYAGATVLATGGIGACYRRTTNPDGATGDGIAMAALAGADVSDMEYVQFHPTASDGGTDPFLVSEAVRGEGALLRNGDGERFMPGYHDDAELAPRDVVARAVDTERTATGEVRLDVSPLDFAGAFPGLAARCEERGVDWRDGIPVAPAEHFLCGGVDVDHEGRASLGRLFAVGECARTGVHGANRLASTSLLEGLVWGRRAGAAAAGFDAVRCEAPDLRDSDPGLPDRFADEKFRRLRRVMDEHVGLRRSPDDLRRAQSVLRRLKGEVDAYVRTRTARSLYELRNASVTALLVARAAAENPASRGCHHVVGDARTPADD